MSLCAFFHATASALRPTSQCRTISSAPDPVHWLYLFLRSIAVTGSGQHLSTPHTRDLLPTSSTTPVGDAAIGLHDKNPNLSGVRARGAAATRSVTLQRSLQVLPCCWHAGTKSERRVCRKNVITCPNFTKNMPVDERATAPHPAAWPPQKVRKPASVKMLQPLKSKPVSRVVVRIGEHFSRPCHPVLRPKQKGWVT